MTTIYITKQFSAGPLKGLRHNDAMPGFKDANEAAAWAKAHKTTPVRTRDGAPYIVVDASFQSYTR
jgi:hypothetical protein